MVAYPRHSLLMARASFKDYLIVPILFLRSCLLKMQLNKKNNRTEINTRNKVTLKNEKEK